MPWFRFRRKKEEQAPVEAAAPEVVEASIAEAVAPDGDAAQDLEEKPKRRRGKRGGRGRKKPGEPTAEARPEERPAPQRKPAPEPKAEQEKKPPRQRSTARRRTAPKRAPLPAAKRELVVSVDVGEQRVAVLEDDRVAEVYLERPERRSIAGNIYLGVVDNVLPGMEAAFVEIGLDRNGFLFVDEIVAPELEGKRHGKRIQDLISRGQHVLVQAVKDPMKTKGARLTTEISLPGRFVVFVPHGEGLGVSRRLPDDERARLKDIFKAIDVPHGGVIVRTAAEGASAEDVERDLVFLQRLWKSIEQRAKTATAPALIYQEAELPLRVVRDLFTDEFERALVDDDRTMKRIVGYLKKTSPGMVERVIRYKEKTPLMEAVGVEAEIKSTLSRRVDLPSGGYLIFDYAEAFTVIDVNTGRFVGSRSKSSSGRLEDTITKNNLEAVKEVVRQLRLRDIGGIIVIDFIDMANPKNRQTVEEALKTELERDRTKTYVVEISPLGLVEMTRQNVTDGPREILTKKCPTCAGDGIVISEASAAIDVERKLRELAATPRVQAFRVEVNAKVASLLVGANASRLTELEARTKRRFFVEGRGDIHVDHFAVLAQGKVEDIAPQAPVAEGQELELKLVEVGLHDPAAGVGKVDGYDVCVGGAAALVGKKIKVRVERVLDGSAYATHLVAAAGVEPPITAEAEAEKPTRQPRARKAEAVEAVAAEDAPEAVEDAVEAVEDDAAEVGEADDTDGAAAAKKRTRRGSRGGRGRKKKTGVEAETNGAGVDDVAAPEPAERAEARDGGTAPAPRIHVPADDLGRDGSADADSMQAEPEAAEADAAGATDAAADGDGAVPKKRTRRGSRGGRNRKKKTGAAEATAEPAEDGDEGAAVAVAVVAPEVETPAHEPDVADAAVETDYVPMSEWLDDLDAAATRD